MADKSRPAKKVPLDYKPNSTQNSKKMMFKTMIVEKITRPRLLKLKKKEFKRYPRLGLGRGKLGGPGMKPRKEGVPFERGSIGLRKKTRTSKSQVGSATGEKRELKRQNKKRQSNRGSTRR